MQPATLFKDLERNAKLYYKNKKLTENYFKICEFPIRKSQYDFELLKDKDIDILKPILTVYSKNKKIHTSLSFTVNYRPESIREDVKLYYTKALDSTFSTNFKDLKRIIRKVIKKRGLKDTTPEDKQKRIKCFLAWAIDDFIHWGNYFNEILSGVINMS